ncbi:hypothetical protein [Flavobacterium laiguense]|jgi:hypothetical protein|uniref:Uncharacterized protein n=1 Tax=Flavobacterium laiguense TaxID=2169409 RepID=A0A2U1K2E0_9FLAO|nr:hypothetical protein [Flavobacterium laiguense]PWA11329.1 hypothetical protein DB891_00460 [Flavobacterium laiguense]
MKELKLFAIYKNGEHKGNERGISREDAIQKYLIASSFGTLLDDLEFVSQYTGSLAIENIHFNKSIFDKNKALDVRKSNVNYWPFIETYYPNYYSCDQILLSDILARKLEGEEICEEDEEMIKDWDVKAELLKLDQAIMQKAMENYFDIKYA